MTRRDVAVFVLRRLLALALLVIVVSFGVFSLIYLAPGSVVDTLLGTNPRTPETVRILRHEYSLDRSFLTQYWLWAKQAAQLHFGNSIQTTIPVTTSIESRLPTSLFLGIYAFLLMIVMGIGGGIASAVWRRTTVDRGIVATAVVGLSTPVFVSGLFLLYLFAIVVHWFPAFGKGAGFVDEMWHLTLPAFSLAFAASAYILKQTRAAVIGTLDQDYVLFARARGLSAPRVLFKYTLRNALIPVVTIGALVLAFLVTGAVLVEATFSLSGMGELLVQSALAKDLPVVQGVAMFIAVVIMVANLLADLTYLVVDPRIRYRRRSAA